MQVTNYIHLDQADRPAVALSDIGRGPYIVVELAHGTQVQHKLFFRSIEHAEMYFLGIVNDIYAIKEREEG